MRRAMRRPPFAAELRVAGMGMRGIDVLITHAAILAVLVLHYHSHRDGLCVRSDGNTERDLEL